MVVAATAPALSEARPTLLSDLFSVELLNQHHDEGYVTSRWHPEGYLKIYNYTPKAVYDQVWDSVTTKCRGLIVGKGGVVVARPFEKFWNINDIRFPETLVDNIPTKNVILDKLDGSLGIFYEFMGVRGVATRGSFQSKQALWATEEYKKRHEGAVWPDGYTPLFEICYSDNRIVCDHKLNNLILIGLVDVATGEEADYATLCHWAAYNEMRVAQAYPFKKIQELLEEDDPSARREGYVITANLGKCPPLKVKVKFPTYVRLHKIMTNVTPKAIWECLKEGDSLDPLFDKSLPDAFTGWVRDWKKKLQDQFNTWELKIIDIYHGIPVRTKEHTDHTHRRDTAFYFQEKSREVKQPYIIGPLFCLYNDRPYEQLVWDLIEPKGDASLETFEEEQ